ncbi:hypothetical protein RF683_01825 [Flavobacterium sp. 20NA77.7]|uniref:Peptidase E n=1 Tax=Flavobacterium nakdongensis TaxID=3073563 RepID=A0ABY9RDJ8_9FLAO|nr:DUF6702 family protein [Flavobacterium sp. 20NA77.7]WMW78206.1 hypothetical protein RF683_01825 [Flavobacterium sp. 20NA77.7]
MNKLKLLIATCTLVLICGFSVHKFYVGVFQVDYFKEKKSVQITARLFIDDLEKALQKKHNKHFYITTKDEIANTNKYIEEYIKERFLVKLNNKNQTLTLLTKEQEDNIVICYIKISFSEKLKSFELTNTILTDIFSEQQNLVHLNNNGNKKTLLFTNTNNYQKINF